MSDSQDIHHPDDDGGQGWFHQEQLLQQQLVLLEDEQYRLTFLTAKRKPEMSLIAKDTGGDRTFEIAPSGAYVARCYRVIDLGTQTFSVMGETKQAHQVLVTWEINKNMSDGKPFTISEKYTVSLHEKAKLRAVLESWRGRKFTEAERQGFDLKNVIGKVCFINIVHTQKGEKTYANVASVMPVPEGLPSPAAVNETVHFDISEWSASSFEKVPKFYQEMIKKSPEFQQLDNVAVPSGSTVADEDDDIPF